MGTNASHIIQVVYMVNAMYLASLKFAGTLRVLEKRKKERQASFTFCIREEKRFHISDGGKNVADKKANVHALINA